MSFVAISKVKYPAISKKEVHDVGLKMLTIAKQQPGFISIAFHQAQESNETMMYWEWESKSNHEACMTSDDWSEIMQNSGDLFKDTEFSIETYERIA